MAYAWCIIDSFIKLLIKIGVHMIRSDVCARKAKMLQFIRICDKDIDMQTSHAVLHFYTVWVDVNMICVL